MNFFHAVRASLLGRRIASWVLIALILPIHQSAWADPPNSETARSAVSAVQAGLAMASLLGGGSSQAGYRDNAMSADLECLNRIEQALERLPELRTRETLREGVARSASFVSRLFGPLITSRMGQALLLIPVATIISAIAHDPQGSLESAAPLLGLALGGSLISVFNGPRGLFNPEEFRQYFSGLRQLDARFARAADDPSLENVREAIRVLRQRVEEMRADAQAREQRARQRAEQQAQQQQARQQAQQQQARGQPGRTQQSGQGTGVRVSLDQNSSSGSSCDTLAQELEVEVARNPQGVRNRVDRFELAILRELSSRLGAAEVRLDALAARSEVQSGGEACVAERSGEPLSRNLQSSWMATASQMWMNQERNRAAQMRREAEAMSTSVRVCNGNQLVQFERQLDSNPIFGRAELALATYTAQGTAVLVGASAAVALAPALAETGAAASLATASNVPRVLVAGGRAAAGLFRTGYSLLLRGAQNLGRLAVNSLGQASRAAPVGAAASAAVAGSVATRPGTADALNTNSPRLTGAPQPTGQWVVIPYGQSSGEVCFTDSGTYERLVARVREM